MTSTFASGPANIEEALADVRTVLWNGPLGVFVSCCSRMHQGHRVLPRGSRAACPRRGRRASVAVTPSPLSSSRACSTRRPSTTTGGGVVARVPRGRRAAGGQQCLSAPGAEAVKVSEIIIAWVDASEIVISADPDQSRSMSVTDVWFAGPGCCAIWRLDGNQRGARVRDGDKARSAGKGRPDGGGERDRADRGLVHRLRCRGPGRSSMSTFIELDGTPNRASRARPRSWACCSALRARVGVERRDAAASRTSAALVPGSSLFHSSTSSTPGKHAEDLDPLRCFMVMPVGLDSFAESFRGGAEIFATPCKILHARSLRPATATKAASRRRCPRTRRRSRSSCAPSRRPATGPATRSRLPSIRRRSSILVQGPGVDGSWARPAREGGPDA